MSHDVTPDTDPPPGSEAAPPRASSLGRPARLLYQPVPARRIHPLDDDAPSPSEAVPVATVPRGDGAGFVPPEIVDRLGRIELLPKTPSAYEAYRSLYPFLSGSRATTSKDATLLREFDVLCRLMDVALTDAPFDAGRRISVATTLKNHYGGRSARPTAAAPVVSAATIAPQACVLPGMENLPGLPLVAQTRQQRDEVDEGVAALLSAHAAQAAYLEALADRSVSLSDLHHRQILGAVARLEAARDRADVLGRLLAKVSTLTPVCRDLLLDAMCALGDHLAHALVRSGDGASFASLADVQQARLLARAPANVPGTDPQRMAHWGVLGSAWPWLSIIGREYVVQVLEQAKDPRVAAYVLARIDGGMGRACMRAVGLLPPALEAVVPALPARPVQATASWIGARIGSVGVGAPARVVSPAAGPPPASR